MNSPRPFNWTTFFTIFLSGQVVVIPEMGLFAWPTLEQAIKYAPLPLLRLYFFGMWLILSLVVAIPAYSSVTRKQSTSQEDTEQ